MASLAELLKRGKKITPFEQADFIARLGASLPENVGGLGLPLSNTAMERARAMGGVDVYHGGAEDIAYIDPKRFGSSTGATSAKKAFWTVSNPETARGYAEFAAKEVPIKKLIALAEKAEKKGNWDLYDDYVRQAEELEQSIRNQPLRGQNIMPLMQLGKKDWSTNLEGQEFIDAQHQINSYLNEAKKAGAGEAVLENLADDVYFSGRPATHYATFDPKNLRSRFAAFDPFRKNEANLLASHPAATLMAAGGLAGMARSALNEPYDPTNQYAKYGLKSPITRGEALKNAVGSLPGIGEVMSGVDALAAAESGDWKSAGLSALGAAPMLGAIKASHGSPHLFDRFDFSKIGTGEGAQAYGHGGYFAQGFDSPVAKQYQENVKDMDAIKAINNRMAKLAKIMESDNAGQYRKFKSDVGRNAASEYDALMQQRSAVKQNPGHLYNVELKWPDAAREAADPLGEHHLLDWDAPLSDQPINAQNALKSMVNDVLKNDFDLSRANRDLSKAFNDGSTTRMDAINDIIKKYPHLTYKNGSLYERSGTKIDDRAIDEWIENKFPKGYQNFGQLYRDLSHVVGSDAAISGTLNNWGIPGIRYLDASSRGKKKGTSNYVMFDDRFPNIVTRNGVSLTDLLRNK